jgi:hypothetical protein
MSDRVSNELKRKCFYLRFVGENDSYKFMSIINVKSLSYSNITNK